MIGGLMYLTTSRPDIAFATFVCARYQARPIEKHLKEVKRIFRYLGQSINMGLWYSKDSRFELIAYSDIDLAACLNDYKSTSGGLQFLGDKLVNWSSKKQDCTAMSNAKAEYEHVAMNLVSQLESVLALSQSALFPILTFSPFVSYLRTSTLSSGYPWVDPSIAGRIWLRWVAVLRIIVSDMEGLWEKDVTCLGVHISSISVGIIPILTFPPFVSYLRILH
ncbi:hypothetical protein Tco_0874379 [Tanacetum coccineum]|uniref:Reverse transcriptase Ty1/copia-type domain-containing protein n=1 Tax=Tanacetum coccineum TaxID=301880 RepID=A0ABQ5BPE5_9ASTR